MQEKVKENLNWIILAVMICFTIVNYYFVYITVKSFQGFNVSGRPIFYMVPFAFSAYICFGIVLVSSILYLWKKDLRFDLVLVSGAQTGAVIGAITIIIGMIWAYVEWGYFWQWEPRETMTLIMWLAYIGLLIFREMQDEKNHEKKATLTSIFGIAATPSVPLTYFVQGALHAGGGEVIGGGLAPGTGIYLMINFLFVGLLTIFLVFIAYRVNKIDFKLRELRMLKMEEI
ncbi:MAG: cytochrome c biogenesis protein CcsA [Candidatus Hodarchaeales archaeon]|jgi:heme exporter protein C